MIPESEAPGDHGAFGHADYTGDGKALFFLALRTGVLTLLTLGIYRFWGKVRIRRYIWSSARFDGARLEYTGSGLEMFLGFLLAVVFLAVYLGLIQMVLFWFGMAIFGSPETPEAMLLRGLGISISALAVLPFVFFAIYRARRYKLARTRWRGIRFGMDKGAWGYVLRAMGYWALTLLSLGALTPLMTFRLEKYMTDRSWFGESRFEQQGNWTELYRAMKHLAIGLAMVLGAGATLWLGGGQALQTILAMIAIPLGVCWFVVGVVSYRVQSFAWLTTNKMLGGRIAFHAHPSTQTVILTYVVGSIVIAIGISVATGVFGGIAALALVGLDLNMPEDPLQGSVVLPAIVTGLGYLATLLAARAGALAAITQPIIAHYVKTLTVFNTAELERIRQRAADTGADAEGFADALDIGGAI